MLRGDRDPDYPASPPSWLDTHAALVAVVSAVAFVAGVLLLTGV